jgi:hypothetical protein
MASEEQPGRQGVEQQPVDLAKASYAGVEQKCDIVMKGGITSGVVYPHAVCELAQTYRFCNVGGTSAGAIAAAAAAAAEYGREEEGFNKLARLPRWLGDGTNLRNLFQPQKKTRKLYAVVLAGVDKGASGMLVAAVAEHIPSAVLGALPAAALAAAALVSAATLSPPVLMYVAMAAAAVAGVALGALGAALAIVLRIGREASRRIPDNDFGLCRGESTDRGWNVKPLTPWLTGLLNDLAHLPRNTPLTFGHLWAGPGKRRDEAPGDPDDRWLQLAMMTTNLTNRRAHQLPLETREWFFDPEEFRRLFPPEVVDWMVDHPPPEPSDYSALDIQGSRMRRALMLPKLPLPAPADLPVIVPTRMSLSFPVLLSAVPLWNLDMTLPENRSLNEWKSWAKSQGEEWDPLAVTKKDWPKADQPEDEPVLERAWFSDGGISSNFPIHFFDRLVPRWPTFTINLRPFAPEEDPKEDELDNTSMVESNNDGIAEWWYRFPEAKGFLDKRLAAFLEGVVRTMQNRADEALMRAPGYRDRIAHVSLSDDEGGMNLTMPPERIKALTARGRFAAIRLRDAYAVPVPPGQKITWDNHRWIRFRSSLAVLEEMNTRFSRGYETPPLLVGERRYADLLADPPSYPLEKTWQVAVAHREIQAIDEVAKAAEEAPVSMAKDQPEPAPQGRIVPRD